MRLTRTMAVATGAAVALTFAACSDDDTTTPNATPSATSAAPVAATNTLDVTAVDYGYTIQPTAGIKAGLAKITFKNTGKEAHMMAAAGIKAGKTIQDVLAALQTQDEADDATAIDFEAGINGGPNVIAPGGEVTTYTTVKAGNYALLCFVPIGAELPTKGAPHIVAGMVGSLTVAAETSTDVAPASDGEVTLKDGSITLPTGFNGKGTYKVTNSGTKPHSFFAAKSTAADFPAKDAEVDAFFEGQGTKPAAEIYPLFAGGMERIEPGASAYITLNLPAGTYTAICTDSDEAEDAKNHSVLGEAVEFTVS